MGSPITFSGFNQIDFTMILNAVMAQERAPLTRLETQKKAIETQNTALATLATKLAALDAASDNLKNSDSLALTSVTSSNAGVGVTSSSGTVTGSYDIIVSALARAQVTASQTTYGSRDAIVAAGTLTLTAAGGGAPVDIVIGAGTTLEDMAEAINANADSPAAASVVQTSPGVYKLVLTGRETGAANAFTLSGTLSGVGGLNFGANTQAAFDASLTVNGLLVTSASNTVTDAIAGVTLSLLKSDPATTVTVGVTKDNAKVKDLVKKFAAAYNDVTLFAKEQATASAAGKAGIGRDPLLRGLLDGMRRTSMGAYAGGTLTRLAEVGLGFDINGKMILSDTVFDKKVASSPAALQTLFSGVNGVGGAFGAMAALVDDYTEAGGLLGSARQRNDTRVSAIGRRLETMETTLALRRLSLQREYLAADQAMTRMKSQSASLGSLGGGYQLF